MVISLTGFMGCGKSSVGRRLSELLCCPFMDLDEVIEKKTGRSIPAIFAEEGKDVFRKIEAKTLSDILYEADRADFPEGNEITVLSLGGGTVVRKECSDLVHSHTICIYLRASVDTLVRHLEGETHGRPMLEGNIRERITGLMSQRASIYESTAHKIIDTDGKTVEEVADNILAIFKQ